MFDFQRTTGVVATIKSEGSSKSGAAGRGPSGRQEDHRLHDPDLSFALEEVRKLAATEGKRFAVIADEAHSSPDRRGRRQAEGRC